MSELLNLRSRTQWRFALALVVGFPAVADAAQRVGVCPRAGRPSRCRVGTVRSDVGGSARGAVVLFLRWVALRAADESRGPADRDAVAGQPRSSPSWGIINNLVFESAQPGELAAQGSQAVARPARACCSSRSASRWSIPFVWGREIENALAALGVTSIVVGLALQEPLGNLFSGLMLLMERPFEVGETIEVGSVVGRGEGGQLAVGAHRGARRRHHGRPQLDAEQGDDRQLLATPAAAHGADRRRVQPSGSPIQGARRPWCELMLRDRGRSREAEADRGDASATVSSASSTA